jgi:hypothetical protein
MLLLFCLPALAGFTIISPSGGGGVDIATGNGEWLRRDGTNAMTGDLNLGNQDILNATSIEIEDGTNKAQFKLFEGRSGLSTFQGSKSASNQTWGIFAETTDGTKFNNIRLYGKASTGPSAVGDDHYLLTQWRSDTLKYVIQSAQDGTESPKPLDITIEANAIVDAIAAADLTLSASNKTGVGSTGRGGNLILKPGSDVGAADTVSAMIQLRGNVNDTNYIEIQQNQDAPGLIRFKPSSGSAVLFEGGSGTDVARLVGDASAGGDNAWSWIRPPRFENEASPLDTPSAGYLTVGAVSDRLSHRTSAGVESTLAITSEVMLLSGANAMTGDMNLGNQDILNAASLEIDNGVGTSLTLRHDGTDFNLFLSNNTFSSFTGVNSTCFGFASCEVLTGASSAVTAYGTNSLKVGTTGILSTTSIGGLSLSDATSTNQDVALGELAGDGIVTTSSTTYLGYTAGLNTNSNDRSILAGSRAGRAPTLGGTSWVRSICLGSHCGGEADLGTATGRIGLGVGSSSSTGLRFVGDNEFSVGSTGTPITSVYLGEGGRSTTSVASVTVGTSLTTGTDISGPDFIQAARGGTGAGAPGSYRIQTAAAGASGTADQVLSNRLSLSFSGADFHNHAVSNVASLELDDTTNSRTLSPTAEGISVGSTQLESVSDPDDAQDAMTLNYADSNYLQVDGGNTGIVYAAQQSATTVDATVTTIYTLSLSDNTAYLVDAFCVARRTDAADRAAYRVTVAAYREAAGSATIQGAETDLHTAESDATWDASFAVSGNDLLFQVTGAAAKTINWRCGFKYETAA